MNITQGIPDNQLERYQLILHPKLGKSYLIPFLTTLDHDFIGLKETYSRGCDGTWTGIALKVVKIFSKFIVTVIVVVVKFTLTVTVITPLVLLGISRYQNRKIINSNQYFEKTAVAFMKASEAHISLGNLITADEQTRTITVLPINYSQKNAVKTNVKTAQIKAKIHQELLDTSYAWSALIQDKSRHLDTSTNKEERVNFFKCAVQDIVLRGAPSKFNINVTNARIAFAEACKRLTIDRLQRNRHITGSEINSIINSYLECFPPMERKELYDSVVNSITSDLTIQYSALMRQQDILNEISDLRSIKSLHADIDAKLIAYENQILALETTINQTEADILDAQQVIGNCLNEGCNDVYRKDLLITNINNLYGIRDCNIDITNLNVLKKVRYSSDGKLPPVYCVTHQASAKDAPLSKNNRGDVINAGLVTRLDELKKTHNEILSDLNSLAGSIKQEATAREEGKINHDGTVMRQGVCQLHEELLSLIQVFSVQPQTGIIAEISEGIKNSTLDTGLFSKEGFCRMKTEHLDFKTVRTESQKLAALQKAVHAKSKALYSFILNNQMTEEEIKELNEKIPDQHDSTDKFNLQSMFIDSSSKKRELIHQAITDRLVDIEKVSVSSVSSLGVDNNTK